MGIMIGLRLMCNRFGAILNLQKLTYNGFLATSGTRKQINMLLSKSTLQSIPNNNSLAVPASSLLQLPEKVLQFGTGVLLRGLPDLLIHDANSNGLFNG